MPHEWSLFYALTQYFSKLCRLDLDRSSYRGNGGISDAFIPVLVGVNVESIPKEHRE
jgi:hypothetical protein